MRNIVALGNPGPEYATTRHNAGWLLVDHLARRWKAGPFSRGERAREVEVQVGSTPVRLIKPTTYMNRSGTALAPLRARPDFDPSSDLLVLVDEVALPVGRFRLRGAGSAGGHNGLKSIEGALQRQDYARLRIGVGPAPAGIGDLADFVLGELERDEIAAIEELLDPMADAVECWVTDGIERAMNRHNTSA